jgi:dUTP pyrophosphatase
MSIKPENWKSKRKKGRSNGCPFLESGKPMAKIQVYSMPGCSDISVPHPATEYSAGVDLRAAVESEVTVESGGTVLIPAGIRVAIPRGYEWQIRPRSGLALKHGITVLNSPGTIDSDYRGPVGVILINHGAKSFTVRRGDRIAQAVLARVESVEMEVVTELSETERGEGGFGHTGL